MNRKYLIGFVIWFFIHSSSSAMVRELPEEKNNIVTKLCESQEKLGTRELQSKLALLKTYGTPTSIQTRNPSKSCEALSYVAVVIFGSMLSYILYCFNKPMYSAGYYS